MTTINDFKFYNYTDKSINIELLCDENHNIWLDKENITTLLSIQVRQVYKYYQLYLEAIKNDIEVQRILEVVHRLCTIEKSIKMSKTIDVINTKVTKTLTLFPLSFIAYMYILTSNEIIINYINYCIEILDNNSINNGKNINNLVKFTDGDFSLNVIVSPEENTVWLTQDEIASLFNTSSPNISMHISNIFVENELVENRCVKKSLTLLPDGRKYYINYYNLDVIISVGYRVKNNRGVIFRQWANKILKDYLLNGFVVNEKRCLYHSDQLDEINNHLKEHDLHLSKIDKNISKLTKNKNILSEKLFYEGKIYDAYSFVKQLIYKVKHKLIILDGYIDITVLDLLNEIAIPITIYTYPSAKITNQDIELFRINHELEIIKTPNVHDRFLIIDNDIYHLGASIKDLGKKRFFLSKIKTIKIEDIIKDL